MSKYLEILFRHRLRFIALFLVLPAAIGAAVIAVFPHETAEASLWTDTPAYFGVSVSATGWNQYLTPAQNTVDSMTQLTATNAFLRTLWNELNASGTTMTPDESTAVLSNFSSDMKITASGSHLVVLNYTCSRKAICLSVLTATIDIYKNWLTVKEQTQAKIALDFYSGQAADAKVKLQDDQKALQDYLRANPGTKPADAVVNTEYNQLIHNVNDDQVNLNALQQKLDTLHLQQAATQQIDSTIFNTVDSPRVTGGQLSSLPKKQLAIAEAACLALAFAVLILMAWSDRTVRDPKELQSRLRIPVVASIPELTSRGTSRA